MKRRGSHVIAVGEAHMLFVLGDRGTMPQKVAVIRSTKASTGIDVSVNQPGFSSLCSTSLALEAMFP